MERFAFKIDNALKANLYKICRLCGMDNKARIPILSDSEEQANGIDVDGEPKLCEKIFDLIGFRIHKNDKMPQTICSLCVDKICDFYEFREMCYATNVQTRKLLGLKPEDPEKPQKIDVKPVVNVKIVPVNKRARKRKPDEVNCTDIKSEFDLPIIKKEKQFPKSKKKRLLDNKKLQSQSKTKAEIKDEPPDGLVAASKTNASGAKKQRKPCTICGERFESIDKLNQHKLETHIPDIPRYICNACDQTHQTNSHIKAHHLWHKLSKAPYKCPQCDEFIPNNYTFARHMREHSHVLPVALQVYDRECPQCKGTFATNFLYNIHRCATRTKRCGGCGRYQRNETEYIRHAAMCSKMYLNHMNIPSEATATESFVRIKNENDIEATTHPDVNMQPFVSLERISSPMLRAAIAGGDSEMTAASAKHKSSKKDSTKNYLKRVDQLLKSTIDTLVSIKHEPEVHMEADESAVGPEENSSDNVFPANYNDEHFQEQSDNDSDGQDVMDNATGISDAVGNEQSGSIEAVIVKQEIMDESYKLPTISSVESVQIKEEPKPFALKLKITMDNGQLNSSLVDDEESTHHGNKKKKKKKRKDDKVRHKELDETPPTSNKEDEACAGASAGATKLVQVKQECIDTDYDIPESNHLGTAPEVTVMTAIPMENFEISCISNGPVSNETYESDLQTTLANDATPEIIEPIDVKPNRIEIDRLLQITHVSGGIEVAEKVAPIRCAVEAAQSKEHTRVAAKEKEKDMAVPKVSRPAVARKSTGAVHNPALNSEENIPNTNENTANEIDPTDNEQSMGNKLSLPQIISVQSGTATVFDNTTDVFIKEEPCGRGYADEEQEETSTDVRQPQELSHYHEDNNTMLPAKEAEEEAFIKTIDFNNIYIKQEKDIDLYDVPQDEDILRNACNGSPNGMDVDEEDEDESTSTRTGSSADEVDEIDQEIREYRELDFPMCEYQDEPVESCGNLQKQTAQQIQPTTGLIISNVCSQADSSHKLLATENNETILNNSSDGGVAKADSNASNTIKITINAEKESENEAKPISISIQESVSNNSATDLESEEEHQNILNHELLNQNMASSVGTAEPQIAISNSPSIESHTTLEKMEISCVQNEETDNHINEMQQQFEQQHQQQQEEQQQQQQLQFQVMPPIDVDDSNINEIAENNNNANIERELQDDAHNASDSNIERSETSD